MTFLLDKVVPWGRSFDEYRRMFALTGGELELRILGCADGPASFNAEATRRGARIVSADPLYRFSRDKIRSRILETYPQMIAQAMQNRSAFVWTEYASVEQLGRARMAAMQQFLDDFDAGRKCGRYLSDELPSLRFEDQTFDLALCSHFLFLYSDQFSEQFHTASIVELCRVATEVRIFPLLGLGGSQSPHVAPVTDELRRLGYTVATQAVDYQFQRGANRMMRILQGGHAR